jgi:hypothetical protein
VRYVLEGSVRKAGERVRITGQLIEAETGAHLWADRFDGSLEDVLDLQDQVAINVAGVIEPALRVALRALTPVVLPSGNNWRDPEQREFFLSGLLLAISATE